MTRAADVGLPNRSLRFADKNNFGPRFGIAYRPTFLKGRSSVEGTASSTTWPTATTTPTLPPHPFRGLSHKVLTTHFHTHFEQPELVCRHRHTRCGHTEHPADSFRPYARVPYVQEWNFAIQRQLNPNTSLEFAYVGNKGTKLETRCLSTGRRLVRATSRPVDNSRIVRRVRRADDGQLHLSRPASQV